MIIDESDATIDAFPQAMARSYSGVSAKCWKGFYKSPPNGAHVALCNTERQWHFFLWAEDLITLSGLSTQQDLALVAALGLTHAERNGHHYVDGMTWSGTAQVLINHLDARKARVAGSLCHLLCRFWLSRLPRT